MEKWKVKIWLKNGELIKKEAPYNNDDEYDIIAAQLVNDYKDLLSYDIRYAVE